MNEFTIFNGTIWFSDADSVYKHLYPEHGFEVESLGVSDRFVSEDAFIAQRNLKDEYMRRDQKHSETISELRKQLEEKQDYIKTLEERIASQRIANKSIEDQKLDAQCRCGIYREDVMERDNTIKQLEAHNENQRKELANLNKVLERERKRNEELEELYSGAQRDVSMLNLKVMELNEGIHNREKYTNELRKRLKQRDDKIETLETGIKELSTANDDLHGIRDSADLTWKEKYDELEEKWRKKYRELNERYISDSAALNAVIKDISGRLKLRENKIETLETGIKELSTTNNDLKKKIRSMEDNEMCLKDRCSKAENTIDAIKEALIDGNYIHGMDLRRKSK